MDLAELGFEPRICLWADIDLSMKLAHFSG